MPDITLLRKVALQKAFETLKSHYLSSEQITETELQSRIDNALELELINATAQPTFNEAVLQIDHNKIALRTIDQIFRDFHYPSSISANVKNAYDDALKLHIKEIIQTHAPELLQTIGALLDGEGFVLDKKEEIYNQIRTNLSIIQNSAIAKVLSLLELPNYPNRQRFQNFTTPQLRLLVNKAMNLATYKKFVRAAGENSEAKDHDALFAGIEKELQVCSFDDELVKKINNELFNEVLGYLQSLITKNTLPDDIADVNTKLRDKLRIILMLKRKEIDEKRIFSYDLYEAIHSVLVEVLTTYWSFNDYSDGLDPVPICPLSTVKLTDKNKINLSCGRSYELKALLDSFRARRDDTPRDPTTRVLIEVEDYPHIRAEAKKQGISVPENIPINEDAVMWVGAGSLTGLITGTIGALILIVMIGSNTVSAALAALPGLLQIGGFLLGGLIGYLGHKFTPTKIETLHNSIVKEAARQQQSGQEVKLEEKQDLRLEVKEEEKEKEKEEREEGSET